VSFVKKISGKQEKAVREQIAEKTVVLYMSSGNFDGMEMV